jgi:hypothetical protein
MASQYDDIRDDSLRIVRIVLVVSVFLFSVTGVLAALAGEAADTNVILVSGLLLLVSSFTMSYSVYVFTSLSINAGQLTGYLSPHSLTIWLVTSVALCLSGVIFFASGLAPSFTELSATRSALYGISAFVVVLFVSAVYIYVFHKMYS